MTMEIFLTYVCLLKTVNNIYLKQSWFRLQTGSLHAARYSSQFFTQVFSQGKKLLNLSARGHTVLL